MGVCRQIHRSGMHRLLELPFHRVMAQCDFLNGGQVGRTLDGLDYSLAGSIELVHVNGWT